MFDHLACHAIRVVFIQWSCHVDLCPKDGSAYLSEQAAALVYLGYIYERVNNLNEAERVLGLAILVQQDLLDQKQPDNAAALAESEILFAEVMNKRNHPELAEGSYEHAADTYRDLAKQDADAYLPRLESVLYDWARMELAANRGAQAEPVYKELLPIAEKLAAINPDQYLYDVAAASNALAALRSDAHQYTEAVAFRRKSADTFRKLSGNAENLKSLAVTLNSLAWDAAKAGDFELAIRSSDESEQILRSFYKEDAATYGDMLGKTLATNSIMLRAGKADCAAAMRKVNEATQLSSSRAVTAAAAAVLDRCKADNQQ